MWERSAGSVAEKHAAQHLCHFLFLRLHTCNFLLPHLFLMPHAREVCATERVYWVHEACATERVYWFFETSPFASSQGKRYHRGVVGNSYCRVRSYVCV